MKPGLSALLQVLLLLLAVPLASAGALPDPHWTPGATNPYVTQANIHQTVCVAGWTKTVRPGVDYTNRLKRAQIKQYGYTDTDLRDYEEDHLISLEIGGNPTSPKNLWPEPYAGSCGARKKDVIETRLKRLLCANEITLAEAQKEIATDWVKAYSQHVRPLTCGR